MIPWVCMYEKLTICTLNICTFYSVQIMPQFKNEKVGNKKLNIEVNRMYGFLGGFYKTQIQELWLLCKERKSESHTDRLVPE